MNHQYIDLLKKILIDYNNIGQTEYKPLYNINFQGRKHGLRLTALKSIDRYIRKSGYAICSTQQFKKEYREDGRDWPANADSMIGLKRMNNIELCIKKIHSDHVEGDLIETGVWRGGAAIFMKALINEYKLNDKKVWVADSFEGLPEPNATKYEHDTNDVHHMMEELAVDLETVKKNFRKYDLLDNNVRFLKGWFKDTLPAAPIKSLCLIRLDGDMYESTMDGLVNLYPKLSKGGFIIIDDWGAVEGCKHAVLDYRKNFNIEDKLVEIDWTGVYWRKTH